MTNQDIARLCERLRHAHGRAGSYQGDDYIREVNHEAASTIERLQGELESSHRAVELADKVLRSRDVELTAAQDRIAQLEDALTKVGIKFAIYYEPDGGFEDISDVPEIVRNALEQKA